MSVWRKILNLPEKEASGGDEFAEALAHHAGASPAGGDGPKQPVNSSAWAEEKESSGRMFARKAGRVLVWSLIALAAFTGVRTWFFPAKPATTAQREAPQAQELKNQVPEGEAQQVAARFARSYMTWNEKAPQAREKELAADLPKDADAKAGWDGKGVQLVAQTIPGAVTQTGTKRARVLVSVRVSTPTGKGQSVSSWRGLQVPVAQSGGRVLVTGQPALVGMPIPVTYAVPEPPETDSELSEATRKTVQDFLAAWAAGTEEQAAAPGADIAPLGGGVRLYGVDTWAVQAGSGDKRVGLATVRWRLGGAQLQQSYRITLTQVSAGGASRWQVWSLTAQ
ncbi:conjugal transfer protein [Streptomyces sp. NPDC090442]|uniref:conjugal transfer protein n=1 Tax=Streptomyces sp. NPDC090442 TaxID=3365962 RepID=UPI003824364B